jgi:hypothetical protein
MFDMRVTRETSHAFKSWLKDDAPLNMCDMSVTLETFQEDRLKLYVECPLKVPRIRVTFDVSQCDRSGKDVALLFEGSCQKKRYDKSVTVDGKVAGTVNPNGVCENR